MKSTAVLLFLFLTSYIFAQEGNINGLILDGEFENEPLAFATVRVQGMSKTVSTDVNGEYSLEIDSGTYNLIFDFVGYESKEIEIVVVGKKQIRMNNQIMYAKKVAMKIASID